MEEYIKKIEELIEKEKQIAFNLGILSGIRSANRILSYWANNHKLVHPYGVELLIKWSNEEIQHLSDQKKEVE